MAIAFAIRCGIIGLVGLLIGQGLGWVPVLEAMLAHQKPIEVEVQISPEDKSVKEASCSGRILDAKTRKGIANLSLQLAGTKEWKKLAPPYWRFTETVLGKTDQEGNYAIPCKGDHAYTLNFDFAQNHFAETDYQPPSWNESKERWDPALPHQFIATGEHARFPDISLKRSRVAIATLTDDAGKPVDGPLIVYSFDQRSTEEVPHRIDKERLTLLKLKPDLPQQFYIRKGKAVNAPTVFAASIPETPIALTISEKNQVTCTGKVADQVGQPILKARVLLVWITPFPREGARPRESSRAALIPQQSELTNKEGKFTFQGLWPGELYYLQVDAEGYQGSNPFAALKNLVKKADRGEMIDFGIITLTKTASKD